MVWTEDGRAADGAGEIAASQLAIRRVGVVSGPIAGEGLRGDAYRHVLRRNATIGNARLDASQNDDVDGPSECGKGSNGGDSSCETDGAGRASRCRRRRAVIRAGGRRMAHLTPALWISSRHFFSLPASGAA